MARPTHHLVRPKVGGPAFVLAWALAAASACDRLAPPPDREAPITDPAAQAMAPLTCPGPPGEPLAWFDGDPCPWALVTAEPTPYLLQRTSLGETRIAVDVPASCGAHPVRCRWQGAVAGGGPVLLATVAGPAGELPVEVWFGASLGGDRVVFTELWEGPPSIVDRGEVGPVFALAPALCGESLALIADPRLPEAGLIAPSTHLLARTGVVAITAEGLVRSGPVPEAPCAPLPLALP